MANARVVRGLSLKMSHGNRRVAKLEDWPHMRADDGPCAASLPLLSTCYLPSQSAGLSFGFGRSTSVIEFIKLTYFTNPCSRRR